MEFLRNIFTAENICIVTFLLMGGYNLAESLRYPTWSYDFFKRFRVGIVYLLIVWFIVLVI